MGTYPQLQPVREMRALLGKFKKLQVACGSDGYNRGMLAPLGTKTGRNAPKIECIFTNPSWLRCLIQPKPGTSVAYIDYEQQEFFIAAVLSEDKTMQETYHSGDPYLYFAKLARAIPPDGTKNSHKTIRDQYKQACLAIQYGQRAHGLAIRINRPLVYADEILQQHQRLFPRYWTWQDHINTQAKLHKSIHTRFGWRMQVTQGVPKEDMTLRNFLIQSTGADILKVACYLLTDAGIKIIAPVHDAVMIEVNLDTAEADIAKAEKLMQKASEIILKQPLRTETIVVRYPGRYIDERGRVTWERVQQILHRIQEQNPDSQPQS